METRQKSYLTMEDLRQAEEQVKRRWKILLTLLALSLRVNTLEGDPSGDKTSEKIAKPATGVKVLLINIDPASFNELIGALESAGFEVITVPGAREALVKTKGVSLVVLDEAVPDIADACLKIRAQSQAPIILIGSKPDARAWNQALSLGADAYLGHSVSRRELIARIKAILRRYPG